MTARTRARSKHNQRRLSRSSTALAGKHPALLILGGFLFLLLLSLALKGVFDLRGRVEAIWRALPFENYLKVRHVSVLGATKTTPATLKRALAITRQTNLLHIDTWQLKEQLEQLPWVHIARVERRFPQTLLISLVEHEPLAVWRNRGRMALLNQQGGIIPCSPRTHPKNLILVQGDAAPQFATSVLAELKLSPSLYQRLSSIFFHASGSLDLFLKEGLRVRLSDSEITRNLRRLSRLVASPTVSLSKISSVDLRIPDRIVIQYKRTSHGPKV